MGPRSHERGNLPHLPLDISPPGLASMGPRSHERGNIEADLTPDGAAPLQWGRVLMNAETVRNRDWPAMTIIASMGPRSHERGNLGRTERQAARRVLQWGRVLMNAETSRA